MKTRQSMTKIKVEMPERTETPSSSEDNENSQTSESESVQSKSFGAIVTNSTNFKKKNSKNPVVSF